ncbi:hypothetical protein EVAR_45328_1 [Eumeta japonica]|uniref:Uncharacterized protein n=1 Tax=Eumeta variegata TaxID=151549 RepID=A0A4C1XMD1_EUMVA|nr:hypothetical protein EVAR_45328_1 [Eumeta japonica]
MTSFIRDAWRRIAAMQEVVQEAVSPDLYGRQANSAPLSINCLSLGKRVKIKRINFVIHASCPFQLCRYAVVSGRPASRLLSSPWIVITNSCLVFCNNVNGIDRSSSYFKNFFPHESSMGSLTL